MHSRAAVYGESHNYNTRRKIKFCSAPNTFLVIAPYWEKMWKETWIKKYSKTSCRCADANNIIISTRLNATFNISISLRTFSKIHFSYLINIQFLYIIMKWDILTWKEIKMKLKEYDFNGNKCKFDFAEERNNFISFHAKQLFQKYLFYTFYPPKVLSNLESKATYHYIYVIEYPKTLTSFF